MQAEQAEPQGVAQVDDIIGIMDELRTWANFMSSSSVCYSQSLGLCVVR